jgi:phosphotransferase system enzyme I (PtsI)
LLLLEDPVLLEEVFKFIRAQGANAEHAFVEVSNRYLAALAGVDDPYLRERAVDMRDVSRRVLHNLVGHDESTSLSQIHEPCLVVAHDLTPSQTALLNRALVLGFATDQGSQTSHTAILARSLRLPAVTGLVDASQQLKTGEYALLDGFNGLLIASPTDQTLFEYGQLAKKQLAIEERLLEVRDQPAVTLDAARVTLSANLESLGEIADVRAFGAEGVGLFRTEYLFLNRDTLPSEEEQFQAYHHVATVLHPQPVIIRTLDLGGDKVLPSQDGQRESNPFLGWRAIRICLQERDLFRAQLRAILRSSVGGNVKLMYPMISGLDELVQANEVVEQCKAELRSEGRPFDAGIEIGAMIEIPAAAMEAAALASRVKFFSIGTNDLIQYTLAVDRMNPKIAHLYDPTHPAVLHLIQRTIQAAHARGIWAGVCGEMAGDPVLAALLLGLGADELSAAPARVPAVKFLIRRLKMVEAQALAAFALQSESSADILARARELATSVAPGLFEKP